MSLGFIAGNLGLLGLHRHPADPQVYVRGGNAHLGRTAIDRYGCASCHVIPGVRNAKGRVGPRLEGLDQQTYIAGRLANTGENLVRWLQDPQKVSPGTAMPDLGVGEQDAKDMAAYLYSVSRR